MIGSSEVVLVVLAIIILFGASKIPELARSLGKASGEFKKAQHETELELSGTERSPGHPPEDQSSKIKQMARDVGIITEGKSDEQLLDEIQKKMKK